MNRLKTFAFVACLITCIMFCGLGTAEGQISPQTGAESISFAVDIQAISKHGNVKLNTTINELKTHDIEVGDIITVIVNDSAYEMPVGSSLTDVDSGAMLCWLDDAQDEVELCVNSGSFAEKTDMAVKEKIEADPGYQWTVLTGSVYISLSEKQGYADEYSVRKLERSNDRGDYPVLTDEEFANFRPVSAKALKENCLYRSSSPLNPAIARNDYAMAAMENAGIKAVLNLADTLETMEGYETFADSYYSSCTILNANMGYDFSSGDFAASVKNCVLFINANEGPYLIHCKEGKDRTGMLCAILSCYAGATYDEILNDYMLTYENFYGVKPGTETYNVIVKTCFNKNLEKIFGIADIETADPASTAYAYLSEVGLTEEDLLILKERIAA